MQTRSLFTWLVAAVLVAGLAASVTNAAEQGGRRGDQGGPGGPGGGRGFGGGMMGGGGGLLGMLRIDEVRKEIELNDDQAADVKKLEEELRGQQPQDRPNFRDMTDEQRTKAMEDMRKRMEEQAKKSKAKLGEILLPHQLERLEQISLQMTMRMGLAMALNNEELLAKLKITPEQKAKLETIRNESMAAMREMFQGGGDNADRDAMRQKMEAARKEVETKAMAVLTDEQKAELEKMKGKPFEMPQGGMFGGRGQGGPGAPGAAGGDRGNRRPRNNNDKKN